MTRRVSVVDLGGMGRFWCSHFLPPLVEDGSIEIVSVVDVSPQALEVARDKFGYSESQCFTDVGEAFRSRPADVCIVVTTPAHHEAVVQAALEHDMDILSEKPIADTLEASLRIVRAVEEAGAKMGVTMSHRFDVDKTTLRNALRSGEHGPVDYLVCRFTCAARAFGAWGQFRHEIIDPLLIEGAVHHLDILEDLAGAPCETVFAQTWNPGWGEYAGDSQALINLHYANGVRALYEGAKANATSLNCWGTEYIRAECERSTVVLDQRRVTYAAVGDPPDEWTEIPPPPGEVWGHQQLIRDFLDWLDGGPPMPTNVGDNLSSLATVFAAIESSRTGRAVEVAPFRTATRAAAAP